MPGHSPDCPAYMRDSQSCAISLVAAAISQQGLGHTVPEPWKTYTVNRGVLGAGLVEEGRQGYALQYRRLSQFGVILMDMGAG